MIVAWGNEAEAQFDTFKSSPSPMWQKLHTEYGLIQNNLCDAESLYLCHHECSVVTS